MLKKKGEFTSEKLFRVLINVFRVSKVEEKEKGKRRRRRKAPHSRTHF